MPNIARQLLREIYRRNISRWSPKQYGFRRIHARAKKLRYWGPKQYVAKMPKGKVQEWWRRYHKQGDVSAGPSAIYNMLTAPVKFDKKGNLRFDSGYGYPRKTAAKIASMVGSKKGIPDSYAPKMKVVYHKGEPVLGEYGERIRRKGRPSIPENISIGRFPERKQFAIKQLLRSEHLGYPLTGKQKYFLRMQMGTQRPTFGMTSGRKEVPSAVGPFYRRKMAAIREARDIYLHRELPAYKRGAALLGTTGVGVAAIHYDGRRKRSQFGKIDADEYLDIIKQDPTRATNTKLLRNLLISGFVLAGLGGLSRLLRSGYKDGLSIPTGRYPKSSDTGGMIRDKIDDIVDNSKVNTRVVKDVISEYKGVVQEEPRGQAKTVIAQRSSAIDTPRTKKIRAQRELLLAFREQDKEWKELDRKIREAQEAEEDVPEPESSKSPYNDPYRWEAGR